MKQKYIILLLAMLFALTACKVGKKYKRPELGIESALWTDSPGGESATGSIDSIGWKALYKDTILQHLITMALENNKDMLTAAAHIKEMAAAKRISFANLFPELDGKLNAQKDVQNYGGHNRAPDPEFSVKAVLSWEVDLWGNLRWANEADLAAYLESIEARRALQLTIISEVAAAYYQLCALDEELGIVQKTLDARREGVRLAKLRFEGGLTSETAYRQAEIELARTETLVPEVEQEVKLKENDILLLLGNYSGTIPRKTLGEQYLPETLPVGLPSSLLERRPDMRRAELLLREANARVGVAQTDMFPKIALTVNGGLESNELGNLLKSPTWFVAGDLLTPLFAMGKNRAALKAERARYEQAVYQYQKSVLEAFQEANNAIITLRKVKEVRASRARLEASTQTLAQLAYLQYVNGSTNYMDVLDAQRSLLDAQLSLNEAELQELLSVVYLYKALGGGY